MRRAVLIYNPQSGGKWRDRIRNLEAAASVLRAASVSVDLVATLGPGTAGEQTREAVRAGFDTVFACGGDGTVHEVLQGLVGTDAALGIIPLGTANTLACDLKIPHNPRFAAEAALRSEPRRIAAGKIEYCRGKDIQSRYFTVAAGVGADARLAYELSARIKRRHGMAAYYLKATQLWAMHSFPAFHVEFADKNTQQIRTEMVTELLAVRITDFGGVLRKMAPRATLGRDDLELVLFKTRSRLSYLRYVLANVAAVPCRAPGIELIATDAVMCRPATDDKPIYAEADGECLGRIPGSISIIRDAFTVLSPRFAN